MCLGNISKDFSVDNMKKTVLNGYAYDFSVDCDVIAVDDIFIHSQVLNEKTQYKLMFGFIKNIFVTAMTFFSCNAFKCISMNNQDCKTTPVIMNFNSNETLFYPYSILVNKCSGSCDDKNNFYAKLCVSDDVKNMNIKVFNQISRTNESRYVSWHETCKCKCKLDASVCNNKQRWNDNKCRCECKELIDKGRCNEEFIWNPSKCECECNKSCDV